MSILTNLQNKIALKVHDLTFDPQAEKYAAEKKAAVASEKAAANAAAKKAADEKAAADANAAKTAASTAETKDREARAEFKVGRMLGTVFGTAGVILLYFAIFAGGIFGASLATNLNVHKSWPYRILYMIYGFVFFPVVVLYVVGYRWFWKGKRPQFYSLIPLLPYHIDRPLLALFFAWLSYRPDEYVGALEEWRFVGEGAEPEPVIPMEP